MIIRLLRKMLPRKITRLPWYLKLVFLLGLMLICGIYYIYSVVDRMVAKNFLQDPDFLELHKCPACFGKSACDILQTGKVKLTGLYKYRFLDHLNVKNVMFGEYNSSKVVIKRLAHNMEFHDIDKAICEALKLKSNCDVSFAIYGTKPFQEELLNPRLFANISDLCVCPSQRLLDKMIRDKYIERKSEFDFSRQEKAYLVTTLLTNPEPIMLQAFPQKQGWPFPRYFGACGRVIVEEYVGKMLSAYYNAPWEERVDYAYQVMKMMEMFTDHFEGFALYWVDLDWENLAVDSHGKVVVVDAENIFVVDKAKIKREKNPGWDEPYFAAHDVCSFTQSSCVSFKPKLMCSRYTSDFNYYTACHNLLSSEASTWWRPGGLLHDLPEHIESKWHLSEMLLNCSKPSRPGERLELKDKIMDALKRIKDEFF